MSHSDGLLLEERVEQGRKPEDRSSALEREEPASSFATIGAKTPRPPSAPPPVPSSPRDVLQLHTAYGNSAVARAAVANKIVTPPQHPPGDPRREGPAAPAPANGPSAPSTNSSAAKPEPAAKPAATSPPASSPTGAPPAAAGPHAPARENPEQPLSEAPTATGSMPDQQASGASTRAEGGAKSTALAPAPEDRSRKSSGGPVGSTRSEGARAGGPGGAKGGGPLGVPALNTSSSEGLIRSIAAAPASTLAQAVQSAEAVAPQIQKREAQAVQASLPEIPVPTGITRRPPPQPAAPPIVPGQAPEAQPPGAAAPQSPIEPVAATGPVPGADVPTNAEEPAEEESTSWWSWLMDAVKNFLARLPSTDSGVDTSAGPRPTLQLSGGADPARMDKDQQKGDEAISDQKGKADAATTGDFGEGDIGPTLPGSTARARLKANPSTAGKGGAATPDLPADARAAFDKAAAPIVRGKVDDQADHYAEQNAESHKQIQAARREANQRLDDASQQARSQQEDDLKLVRKEVSRHRREWQFENEKIDQDYRDKAAEDRKETERTIDKKVIDTDKQVDIELTNAEHKAEQERKEKEKEAARIKQEAEDKPRGFWDRVKGAISSVFNAIKKAVTAVFDALRYAVRKIIEGAKALVHGIIELARMAIVGVIEGFAALLKLTIKIALAAFPETAKKWCDAIDRAKNAAVNAVNSAAQWLKDKCDAILDWLANTIDTILHYLQVLTTTCLELLRLLATGEFAELWKKLKTLGLAMWLSLDYLEGEIYRELIGFDLTQNLGPQVLGGSEESDSGAAEEPNPDPENLALLMQEKLRPDQVEVQPVSEIEADDPLQDQIDIDDGEEVPLGQVAGAGTKDAVLSDLLEPVAEKQSDVASPQSADAKDDETLDKEAASLNPEMAAIIARAFTAKTRGERFGVVKDLLWAGLKQYWREKIYPNLWWIIPAAVLAIAAVIALEILTGGAITAAIPPILELLAAALLANDIARASRHLTTFLEKGMAGDKEGAAHAFAKALAVGVVALLMLVLFEVVGKALKVASKAFMRAGRAVGKATVRVAKAAVTGAARIARVLIKGLVTAVLYVGRFIVRLARIVARMLPRSAEFVLDRGKLIFRGVTNFFAKGVKKLEELFQRLRNFFAKFKGFSVERQGAWIIVYAEFNPKVPVARFPATQTWDTSENARILRKNMGADCPKDMKAHHIVPSTHRRAQDARDILEKFRIDINAKVNGVALTEAQHSGLHTHAYIDQVTSVLLGAKTPEEAREFLETIAQLIKQGRFP